jgi:hypothetical protein
MCRLPQSCSLQGKGALRLAIETAEQSGANLILANDPDADRLAVAERQAVSPCGRHRRPSSGCRAEGSRTALARMHIARPKAFGSPQCGDPSCSKQRPLAQDGTWHVFKGNEIGSLLGW